MSRPHSPARAHFERATAEHRAATTTPADRVNANAYELMLLKLAEDKRGLSSIQSIERRAEAKRALLPSYAPWVAGALANESGVQDDVLITVMVWSIDTGDLDTALNIAAYAIEHKLVMPDQYKRQTGCLIAEEVAEFALKAAEITPEITSKLWIVNDLTANEDMPDEVRAKLLKAIGYGLAGGESIDDKRAALDHLKRALALHEKVGVKKDIEKLEREIKNLADDAGAAGAGG
ncbi:MAG: terminase [Rhodocyclaceae bacterium]|nr:terminase [Rhodocyclaceae bacterium]